MISQLPMIDTAELSLILLIAIALGVSAFISLREQRDRDKREQVLQGSIARIEADQRHYLTARNLGPLHEKVNEVAQDVAGIEAQLRAQNEQLRLITQYVMKQP